MRVITHSAFDWVILAVICIGSIKLAVDTYFLNAKGVYEKFSLIFNYVTAAIFTLEALLKIISLGFFFDSKSYWSDNWNKFDLLIVVVSWVDLTVSSVNISVLKVLRLFRTFRPLRFVTHNANMRIIVTALFKSLGAILNTLIVIVVIWFMFSIIGVNFFAGKFQYCTVDMYDNFNKTLCEDEGGQWLTYDHNFDNSINGIIFLFVLTTQENWPILVYQAVDCDDKDLGPIYEARWYYAYYFVVFLFIGSMFLFNLFVGVMFLNFTKVQKEETASFGDILITENQLNWIEVQKMIIRAEPNYNIQTVPPELNWRKPIHNIIISNKFDLFIAAIIVLNMVQMAMLYNDASSTYTLMLDIFNYVFTGIFTIEMILKLIGYACSFWYDSWNIFDLLVVIASWIDIIFTVFFSTSLKMLRIGPQLLRILRVLRVARLLRLIRSYKRLQDIMEIMQLCLPSMLNVFSLLALVLFICSVMGCYLFDSNIKGNYINDVYNFNNFGCSMILSFKMATGEDWNNFMFDYARTSTSCAPGLGCGNVVAYLFFIISKFVVSFIMLNLFILVVLELFDKFYFSNDNIISQYKDEYERFQENWLSIGATHAGFMLHQDKLLRFFGHLTGPAGLEGMDVNARSREIILMEIRSDSEKNVFFNELLFCTMRRYFSRIVKRNSFIRSKEWKTRKIITHLADKAAKRGRYQVTRKAFITTANPFISIMLGRMALKFWVKYAKQHQERVQEFAAKGIFNYKSDDEEEDELENRGSDRSLLKERGTWVQAQDDRTQVPSKHSNDTKITSKPDHQAKKNEISDLGKKLSKTDNTPL